MKNSRRTKAKMTMKKRK